MLYRTSVPSEPRRGVVLVAVLVVVVVLALAAYQYSELMSAEYRAADSYTRSAQTRAFAESGVHYVAAILSDNDYFTNTLNGNPYDNPTAFQNILVQDGGAPRRRGRFSIVALRDPNDPQTASQSFRFGVGDESGKINLNALMLLDPSGNLAQKMLLTLPNMTDDIAASILDWIDGSSTTPRTGGAKDEYYTGLQPPYHCKNGPLDSIDELLLVKGVTPQLLYGNDRNRNGVLDPEENDGSGTADLGWAQYLTIYSREANVDAQGNPRVYVNDTDLNSLGTKLSTAVGPDLTNFILAYRLYGPSKPGDGGSGGGTGTAVAVSADGKQVAVAQTPAAPAAAAPAKLTGSNLTAVQGQISTDRGSASGSRRLTPISSLYSLITAQVSVTTGTGRNQQTVVYPSPLSDPGQQKQLLPLLLDECTTSKSTDVPARINVNTASASVLSALQGLSDTDVQAIVAKQPVPDPNNPPDPIYQTPAWLITEAGLSPSTVQSVERFITARSNVYRFQAFGYFENGGPVTRLEAVIDTNYGRPRIVYVRDISELGKGFTLEQLTNNAQ